MQDPKSLTHLCTFFPLLINIAKALCNIQLESTINAKCSTIIKQVIAYNLVLYVLFILIVLNSSRQQLVFSR